eukprot:TRINITY_DN10816_c0_g1_i1.p1 TRINITY_DN10816_c0_g1~~TRINITY_DN10816_c0_g1_i1.p1  ORF type:complete len:664 (-),score=159.78 TRINITY_DN10816_c0_g1_i1:83-2074(-)
MQSAATDAAAKEDNHAYNASDNAHGEEAAASDGDEDAEPEDEADDVNGDVSRPERLQATAPLEEYFRFSGRIVEIDAFAPGPDDEKIVSELFSRSRFEAAFPEGGADLPMLLGVDLEWKPDKGFLATNYPVALIQLACWDAVLLIRTVGCKRLPEWLAALFEDESVIKVVASFEVSDKAKLRSSFGWDFDERVAKTSSFLDVAMLAKSRQVPQGLFRMAQFFKKPMLKLKSVGGSNWASDKGLTPEQRIYAADDAFFTLYLLGFVLEEGRGQRCEPEDLERALGHCKLVRSAMEGYLEHLKNTEIFEMITELRDALKDAVGKLSTALGAGGSASLNSLSATKSVQKALAAAQKASGVSLGVRFFRQNSDLFDLHFESGEPRVKLRALASEAGTNGGAQDEQDSTFMARVIDALAAYKPPSGKHETIMNTPLREAAWVPARAFLSERECSRFEDCVAHCSMAEMVETSFCEPDGLLLKLLRHPRASDAQLQLRRCVQLMLSVAESLADTAGRLAEEEAKARLLADSKASLVMEAFRLIENGSPEEGQATRSLRARARILADAHVLAARGVEPGGVSSWERVRDGLERSKKYRHTLGRWLANDGKSEDSSRLQVLLDAAVKSWPEIDAANGGCQQACGEAGPKAAKRKQDFQASKDAKKQKTTVP